jgi:hypothetical protein
MQHVESQGGILKGVSLKKSARKRQLGKPWYRWEDNIKMDLKETS